MKFNMQEDEVHSHGRGRRSCEPAGCRCGPASSAAASKAPKVTISVAALIPGSTPAAVAEFNKQIAEFEQQNPRITVYGVQYDWTGPTFAAELAAGTLPTCSRSRSPMGARSARTGSSRT